MIRFAAGGRVGLGEFHRAGGIVEFATVRTEDSHAGGNAKLGPERGQFRKIARIEIDQVGGSRRAVVGDPDRQVVSRDESQHRIGDLDDLDLAGQAGTVGQRRKAYSDRLGNLKGLSQPMAGSGSREHPIGDCGLEV